MKWLTLHRRKGRSYRPPFPSSGPFSQALSPHLHVPFILESTVGTAPNKGLHLWAQWGNEAGGISTQPSLDLVPCPGPSHVASRVTGSVPAWRGAGLWLGTRAS